MLLADRFASPVGTPLERVNGELPPGNWYTSNPFQNYYALKPQVFAYHTGVDLLLWPGGGAHEPIHAVANGFVTFARRIPNSTWGNVMVIGHRLQDGTEIYSRYGHVENMLVKAGDDVWCGQHIADEGNAFGQFPYHLHFDLSATKQLLTYPADWPGLDIIQLRHDYLDPLRWIKDHSMENLDLLKSLLQQALDVAGKFDPTPPAPPEPRRATPVSTVDWINVRPTPDTTGAVQGKILKGAIISVLPTGDSNWDQLVDTAWPGKYVYAPLLDFL